MPRFQIKRKKKETEPEVLVEEKIDETEMSLESSDEESIDSEPLSEAFETNGRTNIRLYWAPYKNYYHIVNKRFLTFTDICINERIATFNNSPFVNCQNYDKGNFDFI